MFDGEGVNRTFIVLVCIALAVGLLIGFASFQGDLTRSTYQSYPTEADLLQAYFHVFNASQASGANYGKMAAYILVFNITNPSDQTLLIHRLRVTLAENGSRDGLSFSFSGGTIDLSRDFAGDNMDNFWYPHTSRIVAFSATVGLTNLDMNIFESGKGVFFSNLSMALEEGRGGGSAIIYKDITLQSLGNDEYVYGDMFGPGHYYSFSDESISTGWESGRMG